MFKVFNNAMVLLAVCAFALASSGCGGGRAMTQSMPESLTTIDWLLPGEAGTTARDVFLVAASRGEVRTHVVCAGQRPDQVGSSPTDARVRGVISKSGGNASLAGVS